MVRYFGFRERTRNVLYGGGSDRELLGGRCYRLTNENMVFTFGSSLDGWIDSDPM